MPAPPVIAPAVTEKQADSRLRRSAARWRYCTVAGAAPGLPRVRLVRACRPLHPQRPGFSAAEAPNLSRRSLNHRCSSVQPAPAPAPRKTIKENAEEDRRQGRRISAKTLVQKLPDLKTFLGQTSHRKDERSLPYGPTDITKRGKRSSRSRRCRSGNLPRSSAEGRRYHQEAHDMAHGHAEQTWT